MNNLILVAGATGNLGGRISRQLIERGASVRALVRPQAKPKTVAALTDLGVEVVKAELTDLAGLTDACQGIACVVSALQGLHEVIVEAQTRLLQAAVAANVPRFIPSDFCSNFTQQPAGENRNFDLRREFKTVIDQAPIEATSIFNGAFAEILTYNVPLLDHKKKTVGYWGDPDWTIDFTTMDNTATFTAAAAIDRSTPRLLRIDSFQVSPHQLVALTGDVMEEPYELVRMGSLADISAYNQQQRAADPDGERQLYPAWQQSQYLQSMFSVRFDHVDNDRYTGIGWTPAAGLIAAMK